jgi:hypothetical protein
MKHEMGPGAFADRGSFTLSQKLVLGRYDLREKLGTDKPLSDRAVR